MSLFNKTKLKIGNKTYSIKKVEYINAVENSDNHGMIDYVKQEILLSNTYSEEDNDETLLHELIHGFIRESNLEDYLGKFEELDKEYLINNLANIMFRFIQDNFKGELK